MNTELKFESDSESDRRVSELNRESKHLLLGFILRNESSRNRSKTAQSIKSSLGDPTSI